MSAAIAFIARELELLTRLLFSLAAIFCAPNHHGWCDHRPGWDQASYRQCRQAAHVHHHSWGGQRWLQCHGIFGRWQWESAFPVRRGCYQRHCPVCAFQTVPEREYHSFYLPVYNQMLEQVLEQVRECSIWRALIREGGFTSSCTLPLTVCVINH